jgi:membrane associated rhomboid family serine protease
MLLHGSWLHLIVNLAALLAFGAGVERILGGARMVLALLLGGIGGALLHIVVYLDDMTLVVGASGGLSALFGLTMFALAMRGGGWRRLAVTSALWLGLNLAFGLTGMPGEEADIAWVAHMGGYFTGLLYGFWLMRRPIGRQ